MVSSSGCQSGDPNINVCGDGLVSCAAEFGVRNAPLYWPPDPTYEDTPLYFEECDGQPGCDASCRWTDRSRSKFFNASYDSSLAAGWVMVPPAGAFLAAQDMTNIEVNSGSGWRSIGLPPGSPPGWLDNVALDTSVLNGGSCDQTDPSNNLPFSVRITNGAPDASLMFTNASYNYCPWN